MTIAATTNRVTYTGNGATTAFAFAYPFHAQADLVVIETILATGVQTTKALTTDYTISGTTDAQGHYSSGGTVNAITAPASTVTWTIYRDPSPIQSTDFVQNDDLPAESLESALDYQTLLNQRTRDMIARALRQPEGDSATIDYLPAKVTRASKYLAFDADGDPVASSGTTSDLVATPFMETVLDDANAAAARTTLGAAGSGAVTGSELTMATARLLGRTTASTGAVEELSVGASLTLSGGSLSGTAASTTQAGVAELATSAEVQTGTDTGRVPSVSSMRDGLIVAHSNGVVATTSGTTSDFNSIPSWAKRILVFFNVVSTNGSNTLLLQLGDAGGIETSGYTSTCSFLSTDTSAATASSSAGCLLTNGHTSALVLSGLVILELIDPATNTWAYLSVLGSGSTQTCHGAGVKNLSAALDRIRLTTTGGTDAFDAGSVVVHYQ